MGVKYYKPALYARAHLGVTRELTMRKDFIVERQGRSFVLYAGLLDLAHQQGLKAVRTELLQIPTPDNENIAICMATVTLDRDGREQTFTGIGDASSRNVSPAMQTCLIRMAETRAKARALRDAVNVGVAAFEELSDEDVRDGAPEKGYQSYNNRRFQRPQAPVSPSIAPVRAAPTATVARPPVVSGGGVTESQVKAIRSLCQRQKQDENELAKSFFEVSGVAALSQEQASELITALNARSRAS